jgi:hypothetical protein
MIEFDTNKHGVKGIDFHSEGFVPYCCLCCDGYDWETTQDGFGETFRWCSRGLKFPAVKGTCKRQINKERGTK